MARQRERASDRKRRARGGDGDLTLHGDNGEQPSNVSGEVDEFEAALVSGGETDGTPVEPISEVEAIEADIGLTERPSREPARRGGVPRAVQFLQASWAELQRVQWPDRRQVAQATGVVVGFVIIAGAYLGLADELAKDLVNWIL